MQIVPMQAPEERLKVLSSGVQAQRLVPGCVAVGGTAAALYAEHRVSYDTDHVLPDLRARFDEVVEDLERHVEWKTARLNRPVQILGSVEGVPVGYASRCAHCRFKLTFKQRRWVDCSFPRWTRWSP